MVSNRNVIRIAGGCDAKIRCQEKREGSEERENKIRKKRKNL